MTDAQLQGQLKLLRTGDMDAFEAIYTQLNRPIFTVIVRIVNDRALAEDLLQEVFVKLYQSPPPSSVRRPRAYLFQTARNLAIDSLRASRPTVPLEEAEPQPAPQPADLHLAMDVGAAMAALPQSQRQVVSLHLDGGLKFREIAQITHTPLGTVLWRYRQAIQALRDML